LVNNELQNYLAGNDSAQIEVLTWSLLEELRKITKSLGQNSRLPVRILTRNLSLYHISLIKATSSVLSLKSQLNDRALKETNDELSLIVKFKV
jgi:hypothetical protein